MPRKDRVYKGKDIRWFLNACVDVYQQTKLEERQRLALAWMEGNHEFYKEFAESRHLMPAAVITCALDEANHPLAIEARDPFIAAARILVAELRVSTPHVDAEPVVHTSEPVQVLIHSLSTD